MKTYPPGYFTEPVREWAGMRFESRLEIDPRTKRYITEYARQQCRANSGWAPMALPGSIEYLKRGPVGYMVTR